MKKTILLIYFSTAMCMLHAQRIHLGIFGGIAAYNGDLVDKYFPGKLTNGAIGITAGYELSDKIMIRSGFTYSVVGGADRYSNKPDLVIRNLSFETSIKEVSLIGEYYARSLNTYRISPYGFAGLAVFHFNPYTYDATGQKINLKPLSTEGQGINGYKNKPYSLLQMAIPVGAGVKWAVTSNLRVGLELGFRKLFTDYLDDVSGNYADQADLISARGQLSADMAYRGDEVIGGNPFAPAKGAQRGSPKYKDLYYFTGLHLSYRLGGRSGDNPFHKNRNGCPVNVY